jgi:hypothetical protein
MKFGNAAKGAGALAVGVAGGAALSYGSAAVENMVVDAAGFGAGDAFNDVVGNTSRSTETPAASPVSAEGTGTTGATDSTASGESGASGGDTRGTTYQTEFGTVTVSADGVMSLGN